MIVHFMHLGTLPGDVVSCKWLLVQHVQYVEPCVIVHTVC